MSRSKSRLLIAALLLSVQALPAFSGEFIRYSNPRFGITGSVPSGYIAQLAPENGDGRQFISPDGKAELSIYGSYDALGDLAAYRIYLTERYQSGGDVTYEAKGKNWLVLSGYTDRDVFYLRVEQARNCAGDLVYAHMYLQYDPAARARIKPLIGRLSDGLDMAPC